MPASRPKISDVARLAGLSTSSVSRALSGSRPVQPDVAERVRIAADQLGYRPDSVGRSLRTQQTQTFGLAVADILNPFFPLLVQEVEGAAREAGFGLLLVDSQNDPGVERTSVELLLDKRIDALLISPSHRFLSRPALEIAARTIPVVQLDRVIDPELAFVRVDQAAAVAALIGHLTQAGFASFAFIGSDPSVSTSWERQQAFTTIAAEVDPAAAHRVLVGDFTVQWGRKAVQRILSQWPQVDAVICANDLIAFGAMQQLASRGRIAVTGFDDTLIAQAADITSVRQPIAQMAEEAVRSAMRAQAVVPSTAVRLTLQPELVVRGSSRGTH